MIWTFCNFDLISYYIGAVLTFIICLIWIKTNFSHKDPKNNTK